MTHHLNILNYIISFKYVNSFEPKFTISHPIYTFTFIAARTIIVYIRGIKRFTRGKEIVMSKISTDKISVQMYTLRDHTQTKNDLSSTLKRLADMGFKNVQYSLQNFLTADEAKELLSNYGLKNDSPYCADLYNFDADKDNLMHQLTVFDTPYLRISSVPRSENNTDGILRFASEVNRIGKELAYDGINLLYHFHSFEFYKENSKNSKRRN